MNNESIENKTKILILATERLTYLGDELNRVGKELDAHRDELIEAAEYLNDNPSQNILDAMNMTLYIDNLHKKNDELTSESEKLCNEVTYIKNYIEKLMREN